MPKSSYYKFAKIFETPLIENGQGVLVSDPVRVEVFHGSREYKAMLPVGRRVGVSAQSETLLEISQMTLPPDRTYIELVARTTDFGGKREWCENQIDRVVTSLSALLLPDLFASETWRGWIVDGDRAVGDTWHKVMAPISLDLAATGTELRQFSRTLLKDEDLNVRYTLMSKLFAKSIVLPPSEERFLWLWTVLEVFPMRGTTDIRPISVLLAEIVGREAAVVKKCLRVGQLFGARSDLVHNGKLPIPVTEIRRRTISRLEAICLEVIRYVGGQVYGGALERYFDETSAR